jgi:hypothetical protein
MKITRKQLKRIIKEEMNRVLLPEAPKIHGTVHSRVDMNRGTSGAESDPSRGFGGENYDLLLPPEWYDELVSEALDLHRSIPIKDRSSSLALIVRTLQNADRSGEYRIRLTTPGPGVREGKAHTLTSDEVIQALQRYGVPQNKIDRAKSASKSGMYKVALNALGIPTKALTSANPDSFGWLRQGKK